MRDPEKKRQRCPSTPTSTPSSTALATGRRGPAKFGPSSSRRSRRRTRTRPLQGGRRGDNGLDGPLAKGGLNGGHRPPLPCDLPMGGFPYEFGPETERKIPGAWHRLFSAHRLEGRFSDPRPHLEAPAASSRRATRPKISKGAPLGHGGHLPARPTGGPWEEARPGPLLPRHPLPCAPRPVPRLAGKKAKKI